MHWQYTDRQKVDFRAADVCRHNVQAGQATPAVDAPRSQLAHREVFEERKHVSPHLALVGVFCSWGTVDVTRHILKPDLSERGER